MGSPNAADRGVPPPFTGKKVEGLGLCLIGEADRDDVNPFVLKAVTKPGDLVLPRATRSAGSMPLDEPAGAFESLLEWLAVAFMKLGKPVLLEFSVPFMVGAKCLELEHTAP
jgi:hypothetical protein